MNKDLSFFDILIRRFFLIVVTVFSLAGSLIVLLFLSGGLLVFMLSSVSREKVSSDQILYGNDDAKASVYSLPITGVIVGDDTDVSDPWGLFGEQVTYGYKIKHQLIELANNSDVQAVILDINSPGGTIYGAQAIADGVAEFRRLTQKPVWAYVSGLAASGGYWAAASTDKIIADVGTGVGSIGVIAGPYQYYNQVIGQDGGSFVGGVVTEKGIETTYITAGTSKDLGNPYRKLTTSEVESLQQMVNNEYGRFISFVSKKRLLDEATIKNTIGALVYDPQTAQSLKLIDAIASREDMYQQVADLLSVKLDEMKVVRPKTEPGVLQLLLRSQSVGSTLPKSSALCGITKTQLVYHGDVTRLCFP